MSEPNPQESLAAGDPPAPAPAPSPAPEPSPAPSPAPVQSGASAEMSSEGKVMFAVVAVALILIGALIFMIARSGMEEGAEGELVTTKSGLKYIDVKVGDGQEAKSGDKVSVHYTGRLKDGTKFDSSVGKAPFSFELGAGNVIKGWDEGVAGMKVGGKRKLIIPHELGYGARGSGTTIPAFAELHFDVELLSVGGPMFSPH